MTNEFEEEEDVMKGGAAASGMRWYGIRTTGDECANSKFKGENMKHKHFYQTVCLLLIIAALTGCAATFPTYPGKVAYDEAKMKPYKDGKAEFALPEGWVYKPWDPNKPTRSAWGRLLLGKGLVGHLNKESSGETIGSLALYCHGAFVSKFDLPFMPGGIVITEMPDAKQIKIYELETSGSQNPKFMIYSGTIIKEGEKLNMLGYAGSKWTYGFGCKYAIAGFAPESAGESFEKDFVAILRSLKN